MSDDSTKLEHKRLAGVVKGVHATLRKKLRSNDGDIQDVWESHCQNKELLSEYADAMHSLATEYWAKKRETRIDWCYETIMFYFHQGGLQKIFEKELKRKTRNRETPCTSNDTANSPDVLLSSNSEKQDNLSQPSSSNSNSANCEASTANAVVFNSVEFDDSSWEEISIVPYSEKNSSSSSGRTNPKFNEDPVKISASPTPNPDNSNVSALMDSILQDCNLSPVNTGSLGVESSDDSTSAIASDSESGNSASIACGKSQSSILPETCQCPLYNQITLPFKGKIRLLDVGSCYNPFIEFDEFHAVGIDISPAKPSVYYCDFLNLETTEPLQLAPDTLDTYISGLKDPIEKLPKDIFHVCVFSLLLEYFPSQYQRWTCCQKAWELLVLNGLLIIITPDSHGQHRNAPMIKSWKLAIESMGFKRWRYVKKEHIHCMAFRKIEKPVNNDCLISDVTPDLMYIPQDYNSSDFSEPYKPYAPFTLKDEEFFRATMQELPVYESDNDSTETSEEFLQ